MLLLLAARQGLARLAVRCPRRAPALVPRSIASAPVAPALRWALPLPPLLRRAVPLLVLPACAWRQRACCEPRQARLAPVVPPVAEAAAAAPARPQFSWRMFWTLIRPDWWLLVAAVVLAVGSAVVNVQLSQRIAQLVNAVAKGNLPLLRTRAITTLVYSLGQVNEEEEEE